MDYYRLNHDSPQLETNDKIRTSLKPHQKTSLYKMNMLETCGRLVIKSEGKRVYFNTSLGILSDDVGSGKSLTMLSLIALDREIETKKMKSCSSNLRVNVFEEVNTQNPSFRTNLIVVPHNITKQWETYITKHTNLKYSKVSNKKEYDAIFKTYDDGIKYLESLTESDFPDSESYSVAKKKYKTELAIKFREEIESNDLILLSSTKYNNFVKKLLNFRYSNDELSCFQNISYIKLVSRLIIDEADSIKITSFQEISAQFIWFITSNYTTILNPNGIVKYANEHGETQSWYSWSNGYTRRIVENGIHTRGFLKYECSAISALPENVKYNLFILNNKDFIKQSFQLESPEIHSILCKDPPIINVLNNVASSNVMEFINAGDIKGAINSMNCQKVENDSLITVVTKDLLDELHNKKIELDAKQNQIFSSSKAKEESLKKTFEKIKEIEIKIDNLKEKLESSSTCPVCYDSIENTALCGVCNTRFCLECITMWISSASHESAKCPFCRGVITNESLIVVSNEGCKEQKKDKNVLKDKIENLKYIINKRLKEESKILIFSNYDGSFTNIKNLLDTNNIPYSRIMGSGSRINKTVENFNKNFNVPEAVNVLLLNSQYFGSGLNLQKASDIILFHNMGKDITNQVIGRAQRPGRTSKLNIWRLCYTNEIDTKIEL